MTALMTRHARWVTGTATVCAVLLAIGWLVPVLGNPADERVATGFFINVVIVIGLQVFMGNSGIMNFGFVAFAGIGAYVSAILVTPALLKATNIPNAPFGLDDIELSWWVGALIAVAVAAAFAFITGLPLTRQDGIPAAIASLAILIIVHVTFTNWIDLTRGPRAFFGIPTDTTIRLAMVIAMVSVIVARLFKESNVGLQLRSSREDPIAAAAMGVNVRRLRLLAWVLSGAMISAGGVLTAHLLGTIDPNAFYFRVTFLILAMLLLGGQTTVSGPVLGAILVTVGLEVTRNLSEGPVLLGVDLPQLFGLPQFFLGVLIIVVMKFRPEGVMGDAEVDDLAVRARQWLRGRRGTGRTPSEELAPSTLTDVERNAAVAEKR